MRSGRSVWELCGVSQLPVLPGGESVWRVAWGECPREGRIHFFSDLKREMADTLDSILGAGLTK